jgi:hypothetical protein
MAQPEVPKRRRPRRRPFGVLVICGLLLFEAAIIALGVIALLAEAGSGQTGDVPLKIFGVSLSITMDATTAQSLLVGVLAALALFNLVQVVLLLMLKRIGWVLTMLLVGVSLFMQLLVIWRGGDTNALAMLIDAVAALYLNQSEVRRAFGIGGGRIDAALGRSADAVVDAAMGDVA